MHRADRSSRGVLQSAVSRCLSSINLKKEENIVRVGPQSHRKKKINLCSYSHLVPSSCIIINMIWEVRLQGHDKFRGSLSNDSKAEVGGIAGAQKAR
jgi:hypothetical protein